ncbi:MAG: DUF1998 domain-containing protein [Polyangiaceae bacterium]
MHTTSFWLTVPEAVLTEIGAPRATLVDALRGLGAALETVSALALMCDPRDLGQTLGDGANPAEGGVAAAGRDPFSGRVGRFDPTVFLFDAHAGGVGLAPRIYERASELLDRVKTLVSGCPCEAGCPACVGPSDVDGVRKRLSLRLLSALREPG